MMTDVSYDVVVVGGGVAGVAAAIAAARRGQRTALIEKTIILGGLATNGLVNIFLPLCDGHGRQVSFGLAAEMFTASYRYGPGDKPQGWDQPAPGSSAPRYQTAFSPAAFALALDEMCEEAGVDLWLDALFVAAIVENGRVAAVLVEEKAGRRRLDCRIAIDASGDADLAARAGAKCAIDRNFLSLWSLEAAAPDAVRAVAEKSAAALLHVCRLGADDTGRGAPEGHRTYSGLDSREITDFVLAGRRFLREHYRCCQAAYQAGEGREQVFPLALPAMAQFRTTRRICGEVTVSDSAQTWEDSVALVGDWKRRGVIWEVPYRALVPVGVHGLLIAGRCISASGDGWNALRVIPPAIVTGEVSGRAAALANQSRIAPHELPVNALQKELRAAGWLLQRSDLSA